MDNKERYAYSFDPEGDSTPARVVRLVGENKEVLELGCSTGSMTRVLKEHLQCRVTAVEVDPDAAREAEPWCERVLTADIDSLDLAATFGDQRFDVVVAADVLEHLVDPWSCLRAARGLLRPEGYVVVSVPNVANNGVIAALLDGDFPYREKGLLDRTHLRFFARRNLDALFLDTGFKPSHIERVRVPEQYTELNLQWARLPDAARRALRLEVDGDVYQFVVKAYPASESGYIAQLRSDLEQETERMSALQAEHDRVSADLDEHRKAFGEAKEIIQRLERQVEGVQKERELSEQELRRASQEAAQQAAEQRTALESRIAELEKMLVARESEREKALAAAEEAERRYMSRRGFVARVFHRITRL